MGKMTKCRVGLTTAVAHLTSVPPTQRLPQYPGNEFVGRESHFVGCHYTVIRKHGLIFRVKNPYQI